MAEVLLSSEKFIKSVTNISDNVAGKYILPSLREAQEIALRRILGDCLLGALKTMYAAGVFSQEPIPVDAIPYAELIEKCQYFLAYTTIVEVTYKVSYKVGNFGVTKSTDENLQVATQDEIAKQQYYYQSKADACALELQGWLIENRAAFPELRDCDCARMRSNLYSAASSGLWLGGPRGKILPGGGGCCKR